MNKLVLFSFISLLLSVQSAKASFSCTVNSYYPDFDLVLPPGSHKHPAKIKPYRLVALTLRLFPGEKEGEFEIHALPEHVRETLPVKKFSRVYKKGEADILDAALEDLGLEKQVSKVEVYFLGKPTTMGIDAAVFKVRDRGGRELETFIYAWGATGLGACRANRVAGQNILH